MAHAVEPQGHDNLPYWRNTDNTSSDVRRVFRHEPYLLCVLAKRCKEGKRQHKKPQSEKSKFELDHKVRLLAEPIPESPEADEQFKRQLEEDSKLRPGQILSIDDVPVSPVSIDGYNTFFLMRDTKTRKIVLIHDQGQE